MTVSGSRSADLAGLDWRKSSHSGGGNDCVEVAFIGTDTAVRDSKNPAGGALLVSRREWLSLLEAVKEGRLGPR